MSITHLVFPLVFAFSGASHQVHLVDWDDARALPELVAELEHEPEGQWDCRIEPQYQHRKSGVSLFLSGIARTVLSDKLLSRRRESVKIFGVH
jgi:hypothetical protein